MVPTMSIAKRACLITILLTATSMTALAVDTGRAVYQGTCIACHGAGGEGALPGVSDLSGPNGPLSKSDEELKRNILNGLSNPDSPLSMPPKGGDPSLSEDDIDAVIRYMREAFGNR
ncbi:MAG: cytochrome c [Pseudomonadota bacterium]